MNRSEKKAREDILVLELAYRAALATGDEEAAESLQESMFDLAPRALGDELFAKYEEWCEDDRYGKASAEDCVAELIRLIK